MLFNVSNSDISLNFKVVSGATQPASPKENTIWVNTDVAIPSWAFSATEPESPVVGMVWISTGTSSDAQFNALKKMELEVYPTGAKQYVDGAWSAKEAWLYKGGTWVQFAHLIVYLYKDGEEYTQLTGGWAVTGEGKKGTDRITLRGNYQLGECEGRAKNNTAIDLTGISTIAVHFIDAKIIDTPGGQVKIQITSADGNVQAETMVLRANGSSISDADALVDTSSLSGNFYVNVVALYVGSSNRNVYAIFNEIRGEPV